jgi:superfamily II DNA or RNA helicase
LPEVDFGFNGTLKNFQSFAVSDVLKKDFGVLCSPTGSGKTITALSIIAARKQPALVICHTKELLNQWVERIETFMGIPQKDIGVIGNSKMKVGNRITVALIQSLHKCAPDVAPNIGQLIVDECHHIPSKTFTDTISMFDCKYQLGLSATPFRRDGLSKLIFFGIGDVVHEVTKQQMVDSGNVCKAVVTQVETDFTSRLDGSSEYSKMIAQLCQDTARNGLITQHIASEANGNSGIVMVLTDRKQHCYSLQDLLSKSDVSSDVLVGDLPSKARAAVTARLSSGDCRVVVGTAQLLSEGFDCRGISSVVLASPMRFSGKIIQSIGRALRPSPGKQYARILDFCDCNVGVLKNSSESRMRLFRKTPGITISPKGNT